MSSGTISLTEAFRMHELTEALSFDDVLLLPNHSEVLPDQVDVSTTLVGDIRLRIPIVSSPMDTVTESRMAIALAREGGVGVIHRNMPIEKQALEVDRVKRSEHGVIWDPIYLSPDHTVRDALTLMERYHISGVPITDSDGYLVGILTNRDIRFETNFDRPIREVMTCENLITAPAGTTLEEAEKILQRHKIEKLPIVDEHGKLRGLITIKDLLKIRQHPNATKDSRGRLVVGAAVGPMREPVERARALADAGVDFIVVDSAHGHSAGVLNAIRLIKRALPNMLVIGGNVATREGVRALVEAGADAVRVGLGAGSICTTRVVAGVGVPQLYAIMECAAEAQRLSVPLIADGGIRYSGDIVKALAAGASAVMLGNLLAGCEESPGEIEIFRNRAYKVYRGMGSVSAMRQGSSDRYYQTDPRKIVPEGVEGRVPYRGPLSETVHQLVGGLRSGMGYLGARTLQELREKARFIRITNSGLRESHPHSVSITREPPNYWTGGEE
ncbi:MAG: inosine-5'-monophosphate dehydrogenase [Fimbriimonadales bacterium]|nr:MAG: inosine-5'-monophosphate dehydrogenase [Fimbriimonadales bacterium]